MNPLSPEGLAKSREKMKNYVDLRVDCDGAMSPALAAAAQDVFARFCGTASQNTLLLGIARENTPKEEMAQRCASIMENEAYEHRMDLQDRQRRERSWYRRLYRWLGVWVLFVFSGPAWSPVISGNRWVARWYR